MFPNCEVSAEQDPLNNNLIITPIVPENQIGYDLKYFNLRISPNFNQKISIEVENRSLKKIEFNIEINGAGTNSNGVIDYQLNLENQIMQEFKSILTATESLVSIEPGEKKILNFEISAPDSEFDGIIIGAILLNLIGDDNKVDSITNTITYTIGVVLSENDNYIEPMLDLQSVQLVKKGDRAYVEAKIDNVAPTIIDNLEISSKLLKNNQEIVSKDLSAIRVAPRSNFFYRIDMTQQENLEAGVYELYMTVTNGEHTWEWKEFFTIDKKSIEMIKPISIKNSSQKPKLFILITIIFLCTISMLLVFIRSENYGR